MINWTPEGMLGQLFKVLSSYAPASPPGAQPAAVVGKRAALVELPPDYLPDLFARVVHLSPYLSAPPR